MGPVRGVLSPSGVRKGHGEILVLTGLGDSPGSAVKHLTSMPERRWAASLCTPPCRAVPGGLSRAEQRHAGDGLQRLLLRRSRFPPRLTPALGFVCYPRCCP